MEYVRESTDDEVNNMLDYLKINLYNKFYWNYFGADYYNVPSKDNDGYLNKFLSILDDSSNCVGLIQISRKIPRTNVVLSIVVYQQHAGKGFGTRALKETINICRDIGIRNILINTSGNRLKSYYENIGFELVGTIKKWIALPDGKLHDKYCLQLHL